MRTFDPLRAAEAAPAHVEDVEEVTLLAIEEENKTVVEEAAEGAKPRPTRIRRRQRFS